MLDERAEPPLAAPHLLFGVAAVGDVADDDLEPVVRQSRRAHLGDALLSIGADDSPLECHDLPEAKLGEPERSRREIDGGEELGERTADQLLAGHPGEIAPSLVDRDDPHAAVDREDPVGRMLEEDAIIDSVIAGGHPAGMPFAVRWPRKF